MGRGQTTEEFKAAQGPLWYHAGGLPGDPGIVSDAARRVGDLYGLDAEALDDMASDHGWEFHDPGYDEKILDLAVLAAMGDPGHFERHVFERRAGHRPADLPLGRRPCYLQVCVCRDLAPGRLYALGCVLHDPTVSWRP